MSRKKNLTPEEENELLNNKLQLLLRKWQRILRLQDWDIEAKYVRYYAVHREGFADTMFRPGQVCAKITLRHPFDQGPAEYNEDIDDELNLVHELVHIKLGFVEHKRSDTTTEAFVESMARVLIRLHRGETNG